MHVLHKSVFNRTCIVQAHTNISLEKYKILESLKSILLPKSLYTSTFYLALKYNSQINTIMVRKSAYFHKDMGLWQQRQKRVSTCYLFFTTVLFTALLVISVKQLSRQPLAPFRFRWCFNIGKPLWSFVSWTRASQGWNGKVFSRLKRCVTQRHCRMPWSPYLPFI